MEKQRNKKIIDIVVFGLILAAASAVTSVLFYRQSVASMAGTGMYASDMKAYILEMQGLESGYSFPYPIYFKLSAFFNLFTSPEMAVTIALTLLNGCSMVITKLAFNYFARERLEQSLSKCPWLAGVIISLTAVSLYFISMVFPPEGMYLPGIKHRYLGVFTPNPFHNATYMAARPFSILAFLWYAKLLTQYEKGFRGRGGEAGEGVVLKDYILFSLFLLLSTMTKPSFTIVLVGAAGLIMVWRMFRSRFRNFIPTIQLGLCFIPTFIDLLYQYKGVFVPQPGVEGGMGFGFGAVWSMYTDNLPLAIGLAIGFPVLVTILNYRELKENVMLRFSWQVYGMSFAMAFLLYEKGFRLPDFNFSWGYMYGIFFLFVGTLIVLLRATADRKKPAWLLGMQWLAYGWHAACGLYYFSTILKGAMYY